MAGASTGSSQRITAGTAVGDRFATSCGRNGFGMTRRTGLGGLSFCGDAGFPADGECKPPPPMGVLEVDLVVVMSPALPLPRSCSSGANMWERHDADPAVTCC